MSTNSKQKLFSWVHLSDIHFQPKDETFNNAQIRTSLPTYLKEIHPQCDAIIITGDYRYGPKKEQTNATEVCEYIRGFSSVLGIKDEKIFIVPGNHDLDRSSLREMILEGVKKRYDPTDGTFDNQVLDQLSNDFDFYKSIQSTFTKGLKLNRENPHDIIDLDSCYLLLLNTSLTAGTDEDEHNLIIGTKYLCDLLDDKNRPLKKPIIAVGHHGLDMLEPDEEKKISRYLINKGVKLFLCGHTHEIGLQLFCGEKGEQVNVGCMSQKDKSAIAGFSVGVLFDNGDVDIKMYKWDMDEDKWVKDDKNSILLHGFYDKTKPVVPSDSLNDVKEDEGFGFALEGYRLIGGLGCDGINYVWKKDSDFDDNLFVESIASNKRVRLNPSPEDEKISCYTASVSKGCQLSSFGSQCAFCETGTNKYIPLTADDVALQCIFMAEYDSDCPSYPVVRNNKREFTFTGQGEPGFCYPMVRRAIMLTDEAMKMINQDVSRYVIYTCGITDFIPALISDYKNKVFKNRVSVHFSLNAIDDDRDLLMPINKQYPYKEFIQQCKSLYEVTKEKIEVGILLMVNYTTNNDKYISLDTSKLTSILEKLDPKVFTIDLCTVNKTKMGTQRQLSNEEANKYVKIAEDMDFKCKLFASFGDAEESGCGMLSSSLNDLDEPGETTRKHYFKALALLKEAKRRLDSEIE